MKKIHLGLLLMMTALLVFSPGMAQQGSFLSSGNDNFKMLPTGEFALDPEMIYNSAPFMQDYSAVAFNGSVFLIVWTDNRSSIDHDIYGARMSADGTLLDPTGFIICDDAGLQLKPSVTTNGDLFLVVWEDYRNSDIDIYGARVSADGLTLDPNGIAISTAADNQSLPAVGSAEGNFFTLWVDRRSGTNNDIYGSFISNSGHVANPDGLAICTQTSWQNSPDVCYDGSRYFLVWSDQRGFSKDIYGVFLKPDGTLSHVDGTGIVTLFNNQESPAITWSGTQFFLAWEENQASSLTKIHGGRLNAGGTMIDINGIEIAAYEGFDYCSDPHVTAMDSEFIVAFTKGTGDFVLTYDVLAKRVSSDGTVLDADGLFITSGGSLNEPWPAVSFNGSNALITFTRGDNGALNIFGSRVTPTGVILDPTGIEISKGYNWQAFIDMAYDGTNYFAVWCDTRDDDGFSTYGTRINDGGTVLDPEAIEISSESINNQYPSVAFNGTHYLVTWSKDGDIYGNRITKDGVVADPGGFVICNDENSQSYSMVASDGDSWLVAWCDYRNSSMPDYYNDIYGAIISADGSVQDPQGFPIVSAVQDQTQPDLVYADDQYVIVWTDFRAGFMEPDLYGARISTDGSVLDVNGKGILVGAEIVEFPSLAFDSTNFLLCYHEYSGEDLNIKGIRIDQSLSKLDAQPIALSTALRNQSYVDVAWNGEHFMALWMDQSALMIFRISMAKILPDGTVAETGVLSEMDNNMMFPAIVHGPLKQVLTGFSAFISMEEDELINAVRAFGLLIGQGQGPGITENEQGIIEKFSLYPNPATDKVTVEYELAEKSPVTITLFTYDGRLVEQLFSDERSKGNHIFSVSLPKLSGGVYFMKMEAGSSFNFHKLIID